MSDIPNLLKKLRALGTYTVKKDWEKGKRCPECGASSDRPNCAIDVGGCCPAHDHRYYELSSEDYMFKADEHAQAAAALIEKQQGEIKRLREALNYYMERHRARIAELEAELGHAQDLQRRTHQPGQEGLDGA